QALPVPGQSTEHSGAQRFGHLLEGFDRHAGGMAMFDARDDAARHSCLLGEPFLRELGSNPDRPEAATERDLVHRADCDRRQFASAYFAPDISASATARGGSSPRWR